MQAQSTFSFSHLTSGIKIHPAFVFFFFFERSSFSVHRSFTSCLQRKTLVKQTKFKSSQEFDSKEKKWKPRLEERKEKGRSKSFEKKFGARMKKKKVKANSIEE
ncbi:hypothetical protein BO71DRAFT_191701 [Aspergillus ellipticus CBS 707.79]|uniref:Uncharacterized protein n=1 Tax=Aspergillus ellipticus CBS 707.79 TaxID=1448320 RepID=A0A319DX31_9EURO|nr:hypothetical protein BO71DRAFT_191701 [Aspergillus ellipticus CBS 707.79]